jgi:UDP-N-acetyl-D-mannosaminuronate dehydrogenase
VETPLAEGLDLDQFKPTADIEKIAIYSIYLICVLTPIDTSNDLDLEPLEQSIWNIALLVQKGDLNVVESTVSPVTCEQIVLPLIESISGLSHAGGF